MKEVSFEEFKAYWDSEVEKILLRCSKELGFYGRIKKILLKGNDSKTAILHKVYLRQLDELKRYETFLIEYRFKNEKRTYSSKLISSDKKYLSQIIVHILFHYMRMPSAVYDSFDEMFFEKEQIKSYIKEKISVLKLIL